MHPKPATRCWTRFLFYKALAIKHPSQQLRDTAVLGARVQLGWTPSLKKLVTSELQVTIQNDKRSSVCEFFFFFPCFIIHITIYRSRMLEHQWQSTGCIKEIGMSLNAWVMHSTRLPAWWIYSLNHGVASDFHKPHSPQARPKLGRNHCSIDWRVPLCIFLRL